MIKWIKNKIAEYKYKRKMKKKLEELKKKEVADFFGGVVNDKR